MSHLLDMCMDGRGLLQVFLLPFPQGPGCLSCVLFITCYVVALVTIDDPTLLVLGVLVFGLLEFLFDGCISLEMYLDAILTTNVLKLLAVPLVYGMTTCPIVLVGPRLLLVVAVS